MSKWFLAPAFALSIGALGLAPVTATAAAACGGTDPVALQIDVVPTVSAGSPVTVKAQVSNCSGAEWSGNVEFAFNYPASSMSFCTYALPPFSGTVQLKAGETRVVEYRGLPTCFGEYTITTRVFNSTSEAQASAQFIMAQKSRRH
jgi:hypothetical protein